MNHNLATATKEKFKFSQVFLEDKYFFLLSVVSLGLLVFLWLIFIFKIKPAGFPIYSEFSLGADGSFFNVYLLPAVVSLIFALNLILSFVARKREALTSYLLLGTTVLIEGLTLVIFVSHSQLIG